ncbi:unnamed protein product [Chironomus riparius]|uniref:Uncharacterized protein n=1 Tax=Chironomus riparius TaxID=315576 RepID=A0A9N9S7K7_9DIPT|nr:unnamed protein product [Chironomus riparius]
MSYSYNYDNAERYTSSNNSYTRKSPPIWLIVLVLVIAVFFEFFNRLCRIEAEERARQQIQYVQPPSAVPSVAIISEMSVRLNHTGLSRNERYILTDESNLPAALSQSLPNGLNQPSATPRAPLRNDSVPQYDSPPNYEEALELLNVHQMRKDRDTPIT